MRNSKYAWRKKLLRYLYLKCLSADIEKWHAEPSAELIKIRDFTHSYRLNSSIRLAFALTEYRRKSVCVWTSVILAIG